MHLGSTCESAIRIALSICVIELITSCALDVREVAPTQAAAPSERMRDGEWSVVVSAVPGAGTVTGIARFDGPSRQTRRMGICLVQRYPAPDGGSACTAPADCDSASLPAGAHSYCLGSSPEGACHFRPGGPQTYCAGSPALGLSAIAPGTYEVEVAAPAGSEWRAVACFEGCVALPPVASPAVTVR
jgi:hypothetical protein